MLGGGGSSLERGECQALGQTKRRMRDSQGGQLGVYGVSGHQSGGGAKSHLKGQPQSFNPSPALAPSLRL